MFKRNKYATEGQLDHIVNQIDSRISAIELRSYGGPRRDNNYVYTTVVSLLVEAGILIENKEEPKPSVTWNGIKYEVRKVK